MVPLIGYVDRFSVRPGERIAVKVSSRLAEPYQADLVRIIHGDANPAGPGLKFEEVEATFAGTYPLRFQPAHSGSYGIVTRYKAIPLPDPCTIVVLVQPWLPDARRQTVLGDRRRADTVGHRRGRGSDARCARIACRGADKLRALQPRRIAPWRTAVQLALRPRARLRPRAI